MIATTIEFRKIIALVTLYTTMFNFLNSYRSLRKFFTTNFDTWVAAAKLFMLGSTSSTSAK
jgi:hypothetical protein